MRALYDGDVIAPDEPVRNIEGDYTLFAHLETPVLGTLARRTLITTNVVHVLEAANGKPSIFMPATPAHQRIQTGHGCPARHAGQTRAAEVGVTPRGRAPWRGRLAMASRVGPSQGVWARRGGFCRPVAT